MASTPPYSSSYTPGPVGNIHLPPADPTTTANRNNVLAMAGTYNMGQSINPDGSADLTWGPDQVITSQTVQGTVTRQPDGSVVIILVPQGGDDQVQDYAAAERSITAHTAEASLNATSLVITIPAGS